MKVNFTSITEIDYGTVCRPLTMVVTKRAVFFFKFCALQDENAVCLHIKDFALKFCAKISFLATGTYEDWPPTYQGGISFNTAGSISF